MHTQIINYKSIESETFIIKNLIQNFADKTKIALFIKHSYTCTYIRLIFQLDA